MKPIQVGKGREIEKIKIIIPIYSYPTHNRKFKKKNSKKIQKKLENTIRAYLQAKTGWERPRKIVNKNYRSDQFLPDPKLKIRKK